MRLNQRNVEIDNTDEYYTIVQRIAGAFLGIIEEPMNSDVQIFRQDRWRIKTKLPIYQIYFHKMTNYIEEETLIKMLTTLHRFEMLIKKDYRCKELEDIKTRLSISTNHEPKKNEDNQMCFELEVEIKEKEKKEKIIKTKNGGSVKRRISRKANI